MLFGRRAYSNRLQMLAIVLLWSSCLVPSLFAGVWSCALGDARAVRRKTADVAERLNEDFPYSIACQAAAQLDNAACQLVESVSRGAPWPQVQASLLRACMLAGQVNSLVNEDCTVRNDRSTRDYLNELSRRIERLRCNLDKAYAKTQPVFCEPPRYKPQKPEVILHKHDQACDPFQLRPQIVRPYDSFPSSPFAPNPYEAPAPNAFPEDRDIRPIQYRAEQFESARPSRGQLLARIGMEVLRAVAN